MLFKITHAETAKAERLLSYTAMVYALQLALPYTTSALSTESGGDYVLSAIFLTVGIAQRIAIAYRSRSLRLTTAALSALIWFAVSLLFAKAALAKFQWQEFAVVLGTPRVVFPFLYGLFQMEIVMERFFTSRNKC